MTAASAVQTTPTLPATAGHPHPRWPAAVATVLTFGTGAMDVTTLTHLGGVFASVMTGNLALTGLALAHWDAALLTHSAMGLTGYALGVAAGTWITGRDGSQGALWPRSVNAALAVELGVLLGLTLGWEATGAAPTGAAQLGLLAAAAAAMGLQGAAMRGLGVTVTTTYLTGTLTGVIAAVTRSPHVGSDRAAIAALIAAIGGAACEAAVSVTVPSAVPLLMLTPIAVVLAVAVYRQRRAATVEVPTARPTSCVALAGSAFAAE